MRVRDLAIIALAVCFATPALANHPHHHYRHPHHSIAHKRVKPVPDWTTARQVPIEAGNMAAGLGYGLAHMLRSIGPRPAAWCGWWLRGHVNSDPGPSYNLAANWRFWGHPGPAGVGAVVVFPHHVGKIVGQQDGQWVIKSGNDGHAVRTRSRSIAGAIAFRWE